jgi:UDP-N-acetylglucosamine acyltransferase
VFEPSGINRVGLERAGFSKQAIEEIREAFRIYFASGLPHAEALAQLRAVDAGKEFKRWVKFVEESALGLHR